ncbi:MAG TPA: hypothetical protein VHU18_06310 [Rhizomicrobium sp.]|jgi:hypothetical protein|nr:hypothetical protein [Rhizomicrobium sp.]
MACHIETNTFNRVTVIRTRINGASGSMFLSIPASTSGSFEDTSNTDSLGVGDYLAYGISSVLSGSGQIDVDWIGAHFLASDTSKCMIGGSANAPTLLLSGTYYSSLFGAGNLATGDVPRATGLMPYTCTASNYTNYLTIANNPAAATFTLLKNGVASALSITSSPGVSGHITASSDTVVFAANDTCANSVVRSAGIQIDWANAGLLLQASP